MSEQEILDVDIVEVEVTVGRRSHSVRPGGGVVFLQESGCKLVAAIPSHEKRDQDYFTEIFPFETFRFLVEVWEGWSRSSGISVQNFLPSSILSYSSVLVF